MKKSIYLAIMLCIMLCLSTSSKPYFYKKYDNIVIPNQTIKRIATPWGVYVENNYGGDYTYNGYVLSQDRQTVYNITGDIIPKWWVNKYVGSVNRCDLAIQLADQLEKLIILNYEKKVSLMNFYLKANPSMYMLDSNYYMPVLGASCN